MTPPRQSRIRSESPIEAPSTLGDARVHWDRLLAQAAASIPEVDVAWKDYSGSSGRQCVIRLKKRNIAYLKPADGWFLASFALSEGAIASMETVKVLKRLANEVKSSPKYPEGRAARVRVNSEATLRVAAALLRVKVADVLPRS